MMEQRRYIVLVLVLIRPLKKAKYSTKDITKVRNNDFVYGTGTFHVYSDLCHRWFGLITCVWIPITSKNKDNYFMRNHNTLGFHVSSDSISHANLEILDSFFL